MDQANQAGHSHVLHAASLAQELEDRPRLIIRNVDEYEYDPHYVSIGPYHWSRSDSSSLARKADKIACLEAVLSASSTSVQGIQGELEMVEGKARSWYHRNFQDMTRLEFVHMLLLDGCYILVRFGRFGCANGLVQEGEDPAPPVAAAGRDTDKLEDVDVEGDDIAPPVAATGGDTDRTEDVDVANGVVQEGDDTAPPVVAEGGDTNRLEDVDVVRDVFYLVENQIPYFVIETILSKTGGKDFAESNIAAYVRDLLERHEYVAKTWEDGALTESRRLLTKPHHLLHLLHLHLKPTDLVSATGGTSATDSSVGRWRTATEYDFAGIKLKKRAFSTEEKARCILDVKPDRRGGTLLVPCLNIDRETWRILRNLTALEQHNPVVGSHVTAYCVFMSQVACNPQDVALLSKEGIIVHQMGNDGEVADHFANLCKGIVFDANDPRYNYLKETCLALEKRFRSRRGRWMAWLRRKYFSNPWLVVGLVAAAIGLACAVVQAVYSVLSYNKGPN